MVTHFPKAWEQAVESVVLYQHDKPDIQCQYNGKAKFLGIFWPGQGSPMPSKSESVDEVLIAMAAIAERGELPAKMSRSMRDHFLLSVEEVRQKCLAVVCGVAT